MPVPRARRLRHRVDYVVVRRDSVDMEEDLKEAADPTPSTDRMLKASRARRQAWPTITPAPTLAPIDLDLDLDSDSDEEEEDYAPLAAGGSMPPLLVTMTLPRAQQATGVALQDQDPTETVVVSFSPPPLPPPPSQNRGGITQTTEHLLIAAGSIGATIIVVMVALAIYTMKKRGLSFSEAMKQGKYQVTRKGPPPPPLKRANTWDQKRGFSSDYGSMTSDVKAPQPATTFTRSGSFASQRPLMALERSDSFNRTTTLDRSNTNGTSFLLDSPPTRNNSQRTHRRDDSATPSSPVLPLQDQRRSASTRNTRSITEGSELLFHDPPQQERALSPLPPPPTFKQFLFNRPSVSGRPGFGGNGMASRFSWTNSQAPQTPHDPSRDTNSHTINRDSYMTSRSSVPRFRTIDSWVNQQSNRLEEQKLRDQFNPNRWTQTTTSSGGADDDTFSAIPEVPDLPKNVEQLREEGVRDRNDSAYQSQSTQAQPITTTVSRPTSSLPPVSAPPPPPPQPAPLLPTGLPGKNIKHDRHDTRTTIDTAPIFRAHPGTEVRFSTRSAVPSEILDMGRKNSVLA